MEKNNQCLPRPGDFYRHFKGGLYQIISIARDSESGERLVVYQALYGDFSVYARPLSNFCERLDPQKYPQTGGRLRFERIEAESLAEEVSFGDPRSGQVEEEASPLREESLLRDEQPQPERTQMEEEPQPEEIGDYFLEFLEAKSYAAKREILLNHKERFTKKDLSGIYTLLEIAAFDGDLATQIKGIAKYLETQSRFEGRRLRE